MATKPDPKTALKQYKRDRGTTKGTTTRAQLNKNNQAVYAPGTAARSARLAGDRAMRQGRADAAPKGGPGKKAR